MLRIFSIFLVGVTFLVNAEAKRKVTFYASDGLKVTADLYYISSDKPYVVMFHQQGSSRGEFDEIAERIVKLEYNCLSVDLRVGDENNYTKNETASEAKKNNFPTTYSDVEKDLEAGILYAYKKCSQPVVVFGSSLSSTLCLKEAIENPLVSAAIAFSPGEFLKPDYVLKDHIAEINKPVFLATNAAEKRFVNEIIAGQDLPSVSLFSPSDGKGEHGAKALWGESVNSKEYWFALSLFFSKL